MRNSISQNFLARDMGQCKFFTMMGLPQLLPDGGGSCVLASPGISQRLMGDLTEFLPDSGLYPHPEGRSFTLLSGNFAPK
jgi:hypothetical protein